MIDCLLMGDQIAEGMRNYITGCVPLTYQQISSRDFYTDYSSTTLITDNRWQTVIISLGINDNPDGMHTKKMLRLIRGNIKADHVYWILPPKSCMNLRMAVHDVALSRQDGLLETIGWFRENVTPAGYREMVAKVNK